MGDDARETDKGKLCMALFTTMSSWASIITVLLQCIGKTLKMIISDLMCALQRSLRGVGSRWWYKKILNSPLTMDTTNLQLNMK